MSIQPVIRSASYCLAHVPDLVRYGSKPRREIAKDPRFDQRLSAALRSLTAAVNYPPNQTFIGNLSVDELARIQRPWYAIDSDAGESDKKTGRFGEIIDEASFYAILKQADVLEPGLVEISHDAADVLRGALAEHRVVSRLARKDSEPVSPDRIRDELKAGSALPLTLAGEVAGLVRRDNRAEGREDDNLNAHTLLEGLCAKATAAIALRWPTRRRTTATCRTGS